jgi:hypothetical protein
MKMKIPTPFLIGGAAVAALALTSRARAAGRGAAGVASGSTQAIDQELDLSREKLLQYREDAMNAGIDGKFYLVNGIPIWTYLNKPAPKFEYEGTTYYAVGKGYDFEKLDSRTQEQAYTIPAWDGTEVVQLRLVGRGNR